ncbi:serine hydrolase [Aquincola sp. S2]|uniref:Serine hydrolase n=1 Tax=Pseudaquabacterium terrae TaxID=2732868 RepID=A0ABX2ESW0_9BURK|nr:serine hydrolase [Aquabacterium terrae]NRF71835.1 serine hydrolase [Aquabacterium terrae]
MNTLLRSSILLGAAAALSSCSTLPGWMVVQGRSAMTDHRHFHNVTVAASPAPRTLELEPAAAPKLPAGANGEAFEATLERNGTVAFIVLQRGRVVWERYFNGHQRDSLGTSFSVAKSVVSLLLGQAIADGRIAGVDDPITRYVPELLERDPRFARVRLRDLLQMRSGIAFEEEYRKPWSDAAVFYLTEDLRAAVRTMRIEADPDTRLKYSSGDTQLLGIAIERATGQPLARYLEQRLWQPMGAEFPASWSQDSAGGAVTKSFCCLNARAIDFARLGQLMLDGGRIGERQVIPQAWIADSLAVREHAGGDAAARANLQRLSPTRAAFYTWQWRRMSTPAPGELGAQPLRDFYAQGLHGQVIYVAPEQQMVIVRLGRDYGSDYWWPGLMARMARMN